MITAQFEDEEGQALVDAIHLRKRRSLELTVYHAIPCGGPCQCDSYLLPGGDMVTAESVNVQSKRLSDGELAAEYWRAGDSMAEASYDRDPDAEPITRILHRFAALPHYDEQAAP